MQMNIPRAFTIMHVSTTTLLQRKTHTHYTLHSAHYM